MEEKSIARQLIEESITDKNPILDLSWCGLTDDSPELLLLQECKHLRELNLGNSYTHERKVNSKKNKLKRIPVHLPKMLESLDLSSNELRKIEGLGELTSLTSLVLSYNKLTKIEGLEKLTSLTRLMLSYNKLTKIEGLGELTNLTRLQLSSNELRKIEGLGKLTNLTSLILAFNQLTKIEGLGELTNLTRLMLSFNELTKIEGLEKLTSLTGLWLESNQIHDFGELGMIIYQLTSIILYNNPITDTINLTDFNNVKVIQGYLNSRKNSRSLVQNKHIKINIIGTGRIGKTQFMDYLVDGEYKENADSTHGMNAKSYRIEGSEYEAILWDFGGQEYHHGTHTMFLRSKDMNIVLWRNDEDKDGNYSYWLGTARHFAPINDALKPTLLLVQNVWDNDKEQATNEVIHYPDSHKIKKYDISFDDIFNVNVEETYCNNPKWLSKWKNFQTHLDDSIISHADKLGEIPKDFVPIRNKLVGTPLKEINLDKKTFLKKYAGKIDKDQHDYLIDYLEFSGCLLYFGNEIEALKDYVFPDPVFLSNWMYQKVLPKKIKEESNGSFTKQDLNKRIGIQKTKTFMLLAMHFDLFFEDPFSENRYIVPQYLPESNHSFKQLVLELLPYTFCLRFPDFMHLGRFFQFMSSYGIYSVDDSSYWKYGLLFTHEPTGLETLVYYDISKTEIVVHIQEGKGKTEVAMELFDFFAFDKDPDFDILQVDYDIKDPFMMKHIEILNNKRMETISHLDLHISTNRSEYLDVKATASNIKNKFYFGKCLDQNKNIPLDYMTLNLLSGNTDSKLSVFVSYSHKDEEYRKELETHFAMLKRSGRIETWHDRKILPGDDWDKEIKDNLEKADIVLLLLSAYFFNSDYIWDHELRIIRERKERGDDFSVVPIFVRPCDTQDFEEMKFQGAVSDDANKKWISTAGDKKDEVYMEIVAKIRKTIEGY